jgi:hypothetical protein
MALNEIRLTGRLADRTSSEQRGGKQCAIRGVQVPQRNGAAEPLNCRDKCYESGADVRDRANLDERTVESSHAERTARD